MKKIFAVLSFLLLASPLAAFAQAAAGSGSTGSILTPQSGGAASGSGSSGSTLTPQGAGTQVSGSGQYCDNQGFVCDTSKGLSCDLTIGDANYQKCVFGGGSAPTLNTPSASGGGSSCDQNNPLSWPAGMTCKNGALVPESNSTGSLTQPSAPSSPTAASDASYVPLAPIPGLTDQASNVTAGTLAGFLNNLYKYLVGLAAALAVIMIIWGGLEIATQDSVSKQGAGRHRIQQAILGLVLVLSPVIVFSVINPSILNLSIGIGPLNTKWGAWVSTPTTAGTEVSSTTGSQTTAALSGSGTLAQDVRLCASNGDCSGSISWCTDQGSLFAPAAPEYVCLVTATKQIDSSAGRKDADGNPGGFKCTNAGEQVAIQCTQTTSVGTGVMSF